MLGGSLTDSSHRSQLPLQPGESKILKTSIAKIGANAFSAIFSILKNIMELIAPFCRSRSIITPQTRIQSKSTNILSN